MKTPTDKKNLLIALAAVAFVALEIALVHFADRPIALYTHVLDKTHHGLIDFFRTYTNLGKSTWYLIVCGVVTIFAAFLSRAKDMSPPLRRLTGYLGIRAMFVFATIALSGIVADLLKMTIGRARPIELLTQGIYGFTPFTLAGFRWNSMPSGHSTTAFALAFSLAVLFPRLRIVWLAFGLFLGLSRIMVDAHYLSDVLAGALLGWLTVRLFLKYGMFHVERVIFPIDRLPPRQ
ncbi:MAG: phosphatase PAP2 family protein [Alphaproteobacteria bacterium]|nr:phosphatase PAP2 family protein [Alphaproteobacteria bacterium]